MDKSARMHLLTVTEAAQRLSVKPATIRSWIFKRRHLDVVKVGRCVRITEESVERFIDVNKIPAEGKKL